MKKSLELKSKTQQEAIASALEKFNKENLNVVEGDLEVEVLETPSKGFLGLIGSREGTYRITVVKEEEIDIARNFVENILKNAKLDANVNVVQEKSLIKVSIEGKEAACLIGRRGETLDSIQLLTGLALNKINKDSHMRVLVDIENYRSKREESLVKYANKVARDVKKTRLYESL